MILSNRFYVNKNKVPPRYLEYYKYPLEDPFTKEPILIKTYREYNNFYGFSRGDLNKINSLWGNRYKIKDKRDMIPMKYPLMFTGIEDKGYKELRPEQTDTLKDWMDYGYGVVQAPPRWGKTVWLVALTSVLKQRTLILAHTVDLISQIEEEFRTWTNIEELEFIHKKKLIGNIKSKKDFFPLITLSTWQYLNNHLNYIRYKKNKIGFLAVDEAHRVTTECYTKVVQLTNSFYRLGITATPEIKSGLDVLVSDILGPVNAVSTTEQMSVDVKIMFTSEEIVVKNWAGMLTNISKNEKRNRKIADNVVNDVHNKRLVLVTTERVKHTTILRDYINEYDPNIKVRVITGSTPKDKRKEIRSLAKQGKIHVVVAMSKVVELGWNVPRLSALHNTMPIANKPNWYQRLSRVRTKYRKKGNYDKFVKAKPICYVYVDNYKDQQGRSQDGIKYSYINTIKNVANDMNTQANQVICNILY